MRISDLLGDEPDDERPDGREDDSAGEVAADPPGARTSTGRRSLTEILEEAAGAAAAAGEGEGDDAAQPEPEPELELEPVGQDPPLDPGPASHTPAAVFGGDRATELDASDGGAAVLTRVIEASDDDLLPTAARNKPARGAQKQPQPPAPSPAEVETVSKEPVVEAETEHEPTRRERRAARSGGAADKKAARKVDKERKSAERAAAKAEKSTSSESSGGDASAKGDAGP